MTTSNEDSDELTDLVTILPPIKLQLVTYVFQLQGKQIKPKCKKESIQAHFPTDNQLYEICGFMSNLSLSKFDAQAHTSSLPYPKASKFNHYFAHYLFNQIILKVIDETSAHNHISQFLIKKREWGE